MSKVKGCSKCILVSTFTLLTDGNLVLSNIYMYKKNVFTNHVNRQRLNTDTRGVQYVMETAQYITKFYIYRLYNYFYKNVCFLAK